MWTRAELKYNAKINFKRNYWSCVGASILMTLLGGVAGGGAGGSSSTVDSGRLTDTFTDGSAGNWVFLGIVAAVLVFAFLLSVFVGSAIEVGGSQFFIANRAERPTLGRVFGAFRSGHYGNIVLTIFLRDLYIMLWTCLFVIPGLVKSYEYLMVPYILAENPGMDRKAVFAISKRMMDGEKMNAFILDLSFVGWYIVTAVTFGLAGIFYVQPYYQATMTELYAYNRGKAYEEGYIR